MQPYSVVNTTIINDQYITLQHNIISLITQQRRTPKFI